MELLWSDKFWHNILPHRLKKINKIILIQLDVYVYSLSVKYIIQIADPLCDPECTV